MLAKGAGITIIGSQIMNNTRESMFWDIYPYCKVQNLTDFLKGAPNWTDKLMGVSRNLDTDSEYIDEIDAPGASRENTKASIEDGTIVIESTVRGTVNKYSYALPDDAQQDNVSVKVENGVIRVTAKKAPARKPIQVKVV